jgi:hypothetical protein
VADELVVVRRPAARISISFVSLVFDLAEPLWLVKQAKIRLQQNPLLLLLGGDQMNR